MNTEEKIKVMQAWLDGKRIQVRYNNDTEWKDVYGDPLWNWERSKYRVKPEKKQIDWSKIPKDTLCEVEVQGVGAKFRRYFYKQADDGELIFYTDGADSYSHNFKMGFTKPKIIKNPIRPWFGGECPIPNGIRFRYWRRGFGLDTVEADNSYSVWWDWRYKDGDIIAYQVLGVAEGWIE